MRFSRSTSARVLMLALLLPTLVSCSSSKPGSSASSQDRVRAMREGETLPVVHVVSGFGLLSNLVAEVAGGGATSSSLTAPGVEPHDLELTPDQTKSILDADLVIYIGAGFQPSLEAALKNRTKPSVDLLKSVDPLSKDGGVDPHFWLDPLRYAKAAGAIGAALSEVAPESKSTFQSTAIEIATSAVTLDQQYITGLRKCAGHDLITAHTAFGYLAARYQLNQVGVAGLAPEAEPSAKRLQELANLIREKNITTIFSEELFSQRVADTLAREANVKTATLSPIESFTDSEIAHNVGYTAKMQRNLITLRAGLGCT